MNSAVVLASIGGVALLAAGIARIVFPAPKPIVKAAQTGLENETAPDASIPSNVAALPAETNEEIEWQESADVYAPTEVEAAAFVSTLGLTRPPSILPQQAYIFVDRAALEKAQAHLRGNVEVEQGGLLLGQAFFDPQTHAYLLLVWDALPAPDGIETPTFFGYTASSWRALTPQLQQMPVDWTVIGSYHSHPNMGVFLSETDLDTQEEIFCADWQIALVIDPVKEEIGFFVGKDGQKCADWYLFGRKTEDGKQEA